ncbi:MAG: hypothetical protein JSR93_09830, partial [Verrucomicrobia bacterium]|nr:hypothetical protein [Verrucomicrobiota bacterium]
VLLCCHPGSKSHAAESFLSVSTVKPPKDLDKQVTLLDVQISCETQKGSTAIDLYTERGILLLATEHYERAVDDFKYVLERSEITDDALAIGIALWGKTLGDAALNRRIELNNDLDNIIEFIGLVEACGCEQTANMKKSFKPQFSSHYTEEYENNYEFCRSTVFNTVKFMKEFVENFPTFGTRALIFDLIDELGARALKCCQGAGFWRNCVQPMVDKMNVWKQLGYIPIQS